MTGQARYRAAGEGRTGSEAGSAHHSEQLVADGRLGVAIAFAVTVLLMVVVMVGGLVAAPPTCASPACEPGNRTAAASERSGP